MKQYSYTGFKRLAACGLASVLLAGTSSATSINGTIDIVAAASSVTVDKTANTVDFTPDAPSNAAVSNFTGDFATFVTLFEAAIYSDFTYSPLPVGGVVPVWTLVSGSASFDLLAITSIDESGAGLKLFGTGTIHATGFDDTPGEWSFSADTTGTVFTFSSQTASIPDGGTTVALFGLSLIGLAGGRRLLARQRN